MTPFTLLKTAPALSMIFLGALTLSVPLCAQPAPQLGAVQPVANHEIGFTLNGQAGAYYQIDVARDLASWNGLVTVVLGASSSLQYTDSAAPFLATRYYRAQQLPGSNVFIGDHLSTTNGDVIMQPRNHATLLLNWQNTTIYVDP